MRKSCKLSEGLTIILLFGIFCKLNASSDMLKVGQYGVVMDTATIGTANISTATINTVNISMATIQNALIEKITWPDGRTSTTAFINPQMVAASNTTQNVKNVANYVCDGSADELEINNAINSIKNFGGTVVLSEGQFNILSPIWLTGISSITLQGNNSVIISTVDFGAGNWGFITSTGNITNVKIRDLILDGNLVNGGNNGILMGFSGDTSQTPITHIDNLVIEKNIIKRFNGNGILLPGITAGNWPLMNSKIFDNYISTIVASGINLAWVSNCLLGNNVIKNCTQHGCFVTRSSTCSFYNNLVNNNNGNGFEINSSSNCVLVGNKGDGNAYGLKVLGDASASSDKNSITGNSFSYGKYGFSFESNSSSNTVTANTAWNNSIANYSRTGPAFIYGSGNSWQNLSPEP